MALYSRLIENVVNGEEYFAKVFTVNHKGRINKRIDLPIASVIPSEFPAEPTNYSLIGKYTNSFTFIAPENGYYKFVLQGSSGAGSTASSVKINYVQYTARGAGGGGGACVISVVKLNKGDIVTISISTDCSVSIDSTVESYETMVATGGKTGVTATAANYTYNGGDGGVASGGNVANYNGNKGTSTTNIAAGAYYTPANGGAPGYSGGCTGGYGRYYDNNTKAWTGPGSAVTGFVEIYRGDTNKVA